MKRSRLPLHAFRAFEAAAQFKSLTLAADELGVTHAAISHHIRGLEDQLGVVLFDRTTRPMKLTDAGDRLLEAVQTGFDRISGAIAEFRGQEFEGNLVIVSVPGLGANWLAELIGEFILMFPRVKIRMMTSPWHQPSPIEHPDITISYGSAEQAGRRVTLLGQSDFFPVCSPRLSIAHQKNVRPKDLLEYTIIHEHNTDTWTRWFISCGVAIPSLMRGIYFDGAHLTIQAARAGAGIAMGDMLTVGTDLREGRLVRLTNQTVPMAHPYYVTTPPIERLKPAAKAFEAFILEHYRKFELGQG
ncbi:LysR substrate-binding domain-containing protein [Hyphomicrobium facile]|uniref:Transcriptional regulator, LysR family n=1 Tax=Hyphomicrobium facile TaxID=51670 RepID=A0A1I7NKB6_9HYPH|nr:LysR substrate-binding domain-containing protein [Hyphomicrobium facile]SFV35016.1 transcriptional regulator, LysR family [Hyphomicrobium facile]